MTDNQFNELLELFTKPNLEIKPSDLVEHKYEDYFEIYDWEIETDKGWSSIKGIGKTVPYEVWELETNQGKKLKCADTHIVFNELWRETFVKDLNNFSKDPRYDKIVTKTGLDTVEKVSNLGYFENMYDIQVDDENHRYWTNDILSHNSIFLANEAVNHSRAGNNVAVITAEMSEVNYNQRMGANLLDIKIEDYEKMSKKQDYIKNKLLNISNGIIPPGQLHVKEFATSAASVPDVELYLRELEVAKGIKFQVIIIDYINILMNYRNPNSENTYMKIKQIAEDLRAMAIRNNWLVITATQFGKQGWDSANVNMSDISESAALAHTVDVLLGIIQIPEMQIRNEYWLKLLKVRNGAGKNMKCKYNVQYSYMRLIETDEVIMADNIV
jgi:hypothetical protein